MKIFDIRQYAGESSEPGRKPGDVELIAKVKKELIGMPDVMKPRLSARRLETWAPQEFYEDLIDDVPVFLADSTQMGVRIKAKLHQGRWSQPGVVVPDEKDASQVLEQLKEWGTVFERKDRKILEAVREDPAKLCSRLDYGGIRFSDLSVPDEIAGELHAPVVSGKTYDVVTQFSPFGCYCPAGSPRGSAVFVWIDRAREAYEKVAKYYAGHFHEFVYQLTLFELWHVLMDTGSFICYAPEVMQTLIEAPLAGAFASSLTGSLELTLLLNSFPYPLAISLACRCEEIEDAIMLWRECKAMGFKGEKWRNVTWEDLFNLLLSGDVEELEKMR